MFFFVHSICTHTDRYVEYLGTVYLIHIQFVMETNKCNNNNKKVSILTFSIEKVKKKRKKITYGA